MQKFNMADKVINSLSAKIARLEIDNSILSCRLEEAIERIANYEQDQEAKESTSTA